MRPGLYPPRTAVYIPGLLPSGQLPAPSLGPGELAARPPRHKRSSRVPTHILGMNLQVSFKPYLLAGTSQKPQHHRRQRPHHLQLPSTRLAKERTGGGGAADTSPPAPRLPDRASVSMGVTGASRRVVGGSGMAGRRRRKGTLLVLALGVERKADPSPALWVPLITAAALAVQKMGLHWCGGLNELSNGIADAGARVHV